MMAPGTQPTPSSGAVTAAPIPQSTAAPPRPPSVTFVPGFDVQPASAKTATAAVIYIVFMIGFPFLNAGMITHRVVGGGAIRAPDDSTTRQGG